jgi:AraC-like DNA-binding protein
MQEKPKNIKFRNQQNPNAKFDIVKLEDLLLREGSDHSPLDFHLVEFYVLILIENGNGIHTIDFTDCDYQKGTVLSVRKDQIHKFHANSSVKGTVLLFTDEYMGSYLNELEALKSLQLFNELLSRPVLQLSETDYKEMLGMIELLRTEYFTVNDSYSQGIIRSELHILITKLFRIKAGNNQAVYNRRYLSEFIELQSLVENNARKTIRVKDYADMMNVSSKTLNNITKDIINRSAKEFIDDICVKQIKRSLTNTQQTIKEIAYASGFDETSNFYKYFKHRTNITPEQFRSTF